MVMTGRASPGFGGRGTYPDATRFLRGVPAQEAAMPESENPSPRRKARAGIVVVAIGLLIVIVIFVGMNLKYATEPRENPLQDSDQTK
jgi:hypothetical protein